MIAKKVTDLLDLHAVIASVDEGWFKGRNAQCSATATILVADSSAFVRGLVRNTLEMAGYRVVEAADAKGALREMERRKVDVVLAGVDLPSDGGCGLLEGMRRVPGLTQIPSLALIDTVEQAPDEAARATGFSDYQLKFDRDAMLRSLARLSSVVGRREPVGDGEKV